MGHDYLLAGSPMRSTAIGMHQTTITLLLMVATAMAQTMPSLTVGDVTYENVQLKKEYPSSFFIQHSGGTDFIDKSKLNQEQIASVLQRAAIGAHTAETVVVEPPQANQTTAQIDNTPETLAPDEQCEFFDACKRADTAQIKRMLAANANLAKASIRGKFNDTITALQALIDESEKTPDRLEAIKALVEGGVDLNVTTLELGGPAARNPVSMPRRLTDEELDYLLSQGTDPGFGWCAPGRPPLIGLVVEINLSKNPEEKSEMRDRLRILLKYNPDPQLVENAKRMSEDGAYWKSLGVESWQQDKELTAILAGN